MKKIIKLIASCLAAAAMQPAIGVAAPILDQNNPGHQGKFCVVTATDLCGQSFRQTNANIAGAGFFVMPDGGRTDGTVSISIFESYGAGGASGLLASGSSALAAGVTGWVDIFWKPVAVTAGAQYYMVLSGDNVPVAGFSAPGAYAAGDALFQGASWSTYDLSFRTYTDDAPQAVPEPGTVTLLGLGLAALVAGVRRKRARRAAC